MVYSIKLYVISETLNAVFISALRNGGLWCHLARQTQPGLIATDIFQCDSQKSFFVVIDFWTSEQAYRTAKHNPARSVLDRFLCRLTNRQLDLGMFWMPTGTDNEKSVFELRPVESEMAVN